MAATILHKMKIKRSGRNGFALPIPTAITNHTNLLNPDLEYDVHFVPREKSCEEQVYHLRTSGIAPHWLFGDAPVIKVH